MLRRRARILAISALVFLLRPLVAQQPPSLAAGQRVRITAPPAGILRDTGTLRALTADSVVWLRAIPRRLVGRLAVDTVRTAVARSALRKIEVATSRRGHAGVGFLIGLGVGLTVGEIQASRNECLIYICKPGAVVAQGAIVGGLLGAIVGAMIRTQTWADVPLDGLGVVVAPVSFNRLGLGAQLAL